MATRVISTKLAVNGETGYREAMARINGEIKSLNSSLKLAESEFRANANSMAALTAKGDALERLQEAQTKKIEKLTAALQNAQNAQTSYAAKHAELEAKIKSNNSALDAQDSKLVEAGRSWAAQAAIVSNCELKLKNLRKSTEDTSDAQAELQKKIAAAKEKMAALEDETGGAARRTGELIAVNKSLEAELQTTEKYLDAASRGVNNWQDKLNTAQIKLNNLNAEITLNEEYLEEAKNSADGCATSIDRFGAQAQNSAERANALDEALMATGLVATLSATADALEACVNCSIAFESAMAGVSKTTDIADDELATMGDAIQDLATRIPATATEIANVAEAAGQLGIAKEDILSFSEVMVNLGTATNLSSTEAASALAKFANVVSMSADDYERLGSTIVALGNNFATTEADIVSMATRLASTGDLVGLSEAEIMAVATALSSVGIEAEAGGTAVSKLLKQFEVMVATGSPELERFAAVAGMSGKQFSTAWGDNAVNALSAFIDGLGAVDSSGGSAVAVLEELGLTEVRLSNAVLTMASSEGILTKAVNLSNNAWIQNTALSKEAATRYATTESKLKLLSNATDNVKIAVGDKLTPAIGKLADTGADACNWLANFIDQADVVVPLVTASATAMGVLAVGVTGYTAASKVATAATAAFNLVLEANPVFLTVTAVAALAAGLGVLAATIDDDTVPKLEDLTTSADNLAEAMESANAAREATVESTLAAVNVADAYISKLENLDATGTKTDEQAKQYHNTLALLCQVVPDLAQYIDLETDSIQGGTEALRANTEAWKRNALQQAYQQQLTTLYEEYASVLLEAEKNSIGLTQAELAAESARRKESETIERLNELWEQAQDEAAALSEETGCLTDANAFLTDEYYELQQSLSGYSSEIHTATETAERYQEAIDKDAEAVGAAEAEIALATEATANLTGATEKGAEAQEEMAAATQNMQEQISNLAQSYRDAYDAARECIDGQIGLFDTFASEISKDTDTVEKMMARWAEQTANLSAYTENLKLAAQYGLDEGLVQSLSDGSAESAGYLATIIEEIERLGGTTEGMSSEAAEFVEDFNASFSETQSARDEFAEVMAAIETDFQDAVASIEEAAAGANFSAVTEAMETAFANVGIDFQSIGKDAASGLSTGISSSTSMVSDASSAAGQAAIDAARTVLDSHSDSRVMIGVGKDFVGGMATGIKDNEENLTSAVEKMACNVSNTMTDAMKNAVNESVTEFSKITGRTRTVMSDLKNTINSAASGLSLYSTGQELVNGMISGMNNRSNALYRTVRTIVNQAIKEANIAADVRSPSRKTTRTFEFVGDGMALGLENRRQKIKNTMRSVVEDALNLDIHGNIQSVVSNISVIDPAVLASSIMSASVDNNATPSVQYSYGNIEIHIHQQPGEDATSLAYRVMDIMQVEVDRKGAVFNG